MPESRSEHAFPTLDALRGLAALMVVALHLPFLWFIPAHSAFLAVDLFFVLSGVVIAHAYERRVRAELAPLGFLALRVIRLYPLYLLGTVLGLGAAVLGAPAYGYVTGHLALLALLAVAMLPNLTVAGHLYPLNGPAWTLALELLANVVYAGLVRHDAARWLYRAILPFGLALGAAVLALGTAKIGSSTETWYFGLLRVGYSFGVGVWLHARWREAGGPARRARSTVATAGLMVLIAVALSGLPEPPWQGAFDAVVILVGLPLVVYAALWVEPTRRWLPVCTWLGLVSYPVYAIHEPLAVVVRGLVPGFGVSPDAPAGPALGFLVALLALSTALARRFDRPARAWLSQRVSRDRRQRPAEPATVAAPEGATR